MYPYQWYRECGADLIFPIVQTAAEIAGIDYFSSDEKTKTSLKVIGDHVRAVVHMIADGIRAENTGLGYILGRVVCLWKTGTKNPGECLCCDIDKQILSI